MTDPKSEQPVACAKSGLTLDEPTNLDPGKRHPCPRCGSLNRSIRVSASDQLKVGDEAMVRIQKNMWLEWAQIAIAHECLALEARARAVTNREGHLWGQAINDEMQEGMVSIVAAAAALESLWHYMGPAIMPEEYQREVERDVAGRSKSAPKRVQWLLTTSLGPKRAERYQDRLQALFDERGAAMHPARVNETPVPHALGTNVGLEVVRYGSEAATLAVDSMMAVLAAALSQDVQPAAAAWAAFNASALDRLPARCSPATPSD